MYKSSSISATQRPIRNKFGTNVKKGRLVRNPQLSGKKCLPTYGPSPRGRSHIINNNNNNNININNNNNNNNINKKYIIIIICPHFNQSRLQVTQYCDNYNIIDLGYESHHYNYSLPTNSPTLFPAQTTPPDLSIDIFCTFSLFL